MVAEGTVSWLWHRLGLILYRSFSLRNSYRLEVRNAQLFAPEELLLVHDLKFMENSPLLIEVLLLPVFFVEC